MSLNIKILGYCTAVLISVAGLVLGILGPPGDAGRAVFAEEDVAHRGFDRLETARSRFEGLERNLVEKAGGAVFTPSERLVLIAEIKAIVSDLTVAAPRFGTPPTALMALLSTFAQIDATQGEITPRLFAKMTEPVEAAFDVAMAAVSADVEVIRARIGGLIERRVQWELATVGAGTAAMLLFALWVSRRVVGRVSESRDIAEALASDRLDIAIPLQSDTEFSSLYKALREIRSGIVAHRHAHQAMLARQATSFDSTLAEQHQRFVAAVNNMSQGLCMLDAEHNLVAFNQPFAVFFPHFRQGARADEVRADPRFSSFLSTQDTGSFIHTTPGGQTLQVKRQGITGGGLVMTLEDITDQHITSQRLAHLAGHDGLTDLPNRRHFRESLGRHLTEGAKGRPISVMAMDLNGFKAINDSFGHPFGDALLMLVSARLTECAGPNAMVARLGGDEFALLQRGDGGASAAVGLAEALLSAFDAAFEVEGRSVQIGIAIGIVPLGAGVPKTLTADIVMQNCDLALYSAKLEKRSAYKVYEAPMREAIELRRGIEADLREALARGEFELHYQPFVNADSQAVSGFEALLRWRHPRRGLVSPANFIPIAEDLGLIKEIGIWAIDEACAEAARWPAALTISVNLSSVQFRDVRLVPAVSAILKRSGLDPKRLQLEVTESLFLENSEDVLAVLSALRGLGALISMDDFGTGYSSLGYLTRFPFDKIKIDQSFVREIRKPESMAVIRAVIGLSRSMGMAVIAEGIETAEQYELLHREGCREMQGYLFGRPQPASELPQALIGVPRRWAALTTPAAKPPSAIAAA